MIDQLAVALLLVAAATPPQPPASAIVCAVKSGEKRSYWSEQAAIRDGAIVLFAGECPWSSGAGEGG